MKEQNKTVFVGLSGGVDSSVSALRLIKAGYSVVGVFIKTWQPDFLACNWEAERLEAMRVSAHLGIPFLTCDAEETYKHDVAEYMINEYKAGRTPNPDVMCNKFVKFGTFLEYAIEHGAYKIATGHYAQVTETDGLFHLYRGVDAQKDQSYFLWTLTQEQLSKIYFPVGDSDKSVIRAEAMIAKVPTYAKTDSQGICFLGEVDIQDFLSHYVLVEKGSVLNIEGQIIGNHNGAIFYTIGQRHGFEIETSDVKTAPHYIIAKDVDKNTLTVAKEPLQLSGNKMYLSHLNKISDIPPVCEAQFRYRQKPFVVRVTDITDTSCVVSIDDSSIEMPSLGQSCVFYQKNECLGGGIIDTITK